MRRSLIVTLAVAVVAVAGCSSGDDATPATFRPASVSVLSGDVAIAQVLDDFEYYGACGTETVLVGTTMFYPLLPEDLSRFDTTRYAAPDTTDAKSGLVARVVAPGPGDDIGTMIVYEDGFARFESESGRVLWLTDEEQTYNWVC